jgi:xanthine dehydrogenase YagS FAD-binding subunit
MLPRFAYARPTSLTEALELMDSAAARIHAGGTDLIGFLRDAVLPEPELIVSLSRIDRLRGIRVADDGSTHVGALTPLAEIAASEHIQGAYPALAEAASQVASPQLRNQGTLGGNLCQKPRCWYYRGDFDCLRKGGDLCFAVGGDNRYHCIFGGQMCFYVHPSDTAAALVALGATVTAASASGSRTIPVERLHVPPAEDPTRETVLDSKQILTEVVLPAGTFRSSYRKVKIRGAWDFALAGVALALAVDNNVIRTARVVLSGVAPVPWRALATEQTLTGNALDQPTIAAAAAAAVVGAEPLSGNAYKVPLVEGLVAEQLQALAAA